MNAVTDMYPRRSAPNGPVYGRIPFLERLFTASIFRRRWPSVFSILSCFVQPLAANPADLDPSFGGTGKVSIPMGGVYSQAYSVNVQPDGKVVMAGVMTQAGSDSALVRLNANGTLDTTFGGTGKVVQDFGANEFLFCSALQSDGKIVAGGATEKQNSYDFMVVRYNPDGTPDSSFNVSGRVTSDLGSTYEIIRSLAIQSDGKIVVTGDTSAGPAPAIGVARFNSNGTPDNSFNGSGKIITSIGTECNPVKVLIQNDGKVVVAGSAKSGGQYSFALVRYNTNGSVDSGFGNAGVVLTDPAKMSSATSAALQSDGKILVCGDSAFVAGSGDFAVARFNTDGSLDPSFYGTGVVNSSIGELGSRASCVAVQPGGKILVGGLAFGSAGQICTLVRLNIDGDFDQDFKGGAVTVPSWGEPRDISLQPDGKIVVAASFSDFSALRFVGDSPPNTPEILVQEPVGTNLASGVTRDFGAAAPGDVVNIEFTVRSVGSAALSGVSATIDGTNATDFSIISSPAGTVGPGTSTAFTVAFNPHATGTGTATLHLVSNDSGDSPFNIHLAGLGATGGLDTTFTPALTNGIITRICPQPHRKIIIAGTFTTVNNTPHSYVARVEEDGALDSSFTSEVSRAVSHLVMQMDGKFVVLTSAGLARFHSDGSADPTFHSPDAGSPIAGFGLQPDGKMIIISDAGGIQRISSDGTFEPDFHPEVIVGGNFMGRPTALAVKGDGGFMVAGYSTPGLPLSFAEFAPDGTNVRRFEIADPVGRHPDVRLYSLVTLQRDEFGYSGQTSTEDPDGFFIPGTAGLDGLVTWMGGQSNGNTMIAGTFNHAGGAEHPGFARLTPAIDGTLIAKFPFGPVALTEDGFFLSGLGQPGPFNQDQLRKFINGPATQNLSAPDSSRLLWLRGGTSPVALQAAFDLSTDEGTTWSALGAGSPIDGGWELTGLNLPANGRIRARARTVTGDFYGFAESQAEISVTPVPDITIEQPAGLALTSDGAPPVDFGPVTGGTSATLTFTVRNDGFADLTGLTVTKTADGTPDDFTIEAPGSTALSHGSFATFKVAFAPAETGPRTATLHVTSSDPDENPFVIHLTGMLATASEAWRLKYFGTVANTGTAADLGDPDGDGVVNLMEYATGTHPLQQAFPVGELVKNGNSLEFTYTRLKAATQELNYVVEWTESLKGGTWSTTGGSAFTVTGDDGEILTGTTILPAGSNGKRFVRLRVTRK